MNIVLRILAGILALVLIAGYVLKSIMTDSWNKGILVLLLVALFGMYALRGNKWPQKFFFGNINKKNDGNDYQHSSDFSWLKNLFRKRR